MVASQKGFIVINYLKLLLPISGSCLVSAWYCSIFAT